MNVKLSYTQIISIKKATMLVLASLIFSVGCNGASSYKEYPIGIIEFDDGSMLKTYIALTDEQQEKGLSGIRDQEFSESEAMLFPKKSIKPRQFWMPNTYFDLDIIFLTKDFYILDIHRSLKHYPQEGPRHKVPRSKTVRAQHVLEIRSDSKFSKKIYPGMKLKWSYEKPLGQIK